MVFTEKQYEAMKDELVNCQNPLFLFDDDPDGLCSFLLLYRFKKEGYGIVVKSAPKVDSQYHKSIELYKPDKVFILDIPKADESFFEGLNLPVIWIDHHEPQEHDKARYFNPRSISNVNFSTTNICYNVVKQDLWIAGVGSIADWVLPDFFPALKKEFADLIDEDMEKPEDVMFSSKFGKLIRIFSFMMKGKSVEVMKNIKILTRIDSPYEILEQTSSRGKYIYKRFLKINKEYEELYNKVKIEKEDPFIVFTYTAKSLSMTHDLANQIYYENPEKVVIVGREKSGEVKMSIRSRDCILPPMLQKALRGVEGYGGGHEHACGSCVKKEDFEQFVNNLRTEIKS